MTRHAPAALLFAALAVVWTFPVITNLSGLVPGSAGDNLLFLWNFWWMRHALESGAGFFYTTYMFAPVGASLTLDTHTALLAFFGATVARPLPLAAALNLTILLSLFLNGFCTYLLAWRITRDRGAAAIGGLVFACSSYLAGHLLGHFNLTTAWPIPLFAMTAFEALRGRRGFAIAAGLVLGATAYVDYYYVIYEVMLLALIGALVARDWSLALDREGPRARTMAARVFGALAALAGAWVAAIAVTGGFTLTLGAATLSAHGLFNPLQAFWILLGVSLWLRFRPKLIAPSRAGWATLLGPTIVVGVAFTICSSPLLIEAVTLIARGDYVTQTYFWRSAPTGVDLATLALGPPFHGAIGSAIRSVYDAAGIDAIESSAWLGLVPMLLAAAAIRRGTQSALTPELRRAVRDWAAISLIFFVWALGPHLMVLGRNTGMILPEAFARYVPILNNARIPGRAMVVVTLGLAVLAAIGATRLRAEAGGRSSLVIATLGAAIVLELLPAPFPMASLTQPPLYQTLRDRPERGAVCELPLGLLDGFGGHGAMDPRVFYFQTIHQRPLVGGYLSRVPASVAERYNADPLLAGLISLSDSVTPADPIELPDGPVAGERLHANGIAFVVLNRKLSPPRLIEYVEKVLPLEAIEQDDVRTLYRVR